MLESPCMRPSRLIPRAGGGLRVPEGDMGASPVVEGRSDATEAPSTAEGGEGMRGELATELARAGFDTQQEVTDIRPDMVVEKLTFCNNFIHNICLPGQRCYRGRRGGNGLR